MYTKLNTNTLYNTLCTIHCVQYTVYNTLCTIHCVQYTVYKTLCKIHCVKYTVYNSLCTIYKMNSPGLFYLFISITMFTNCARAAQTSTKNKKSISTKNYVHNSRVMSKFRNGKSQKSESL